MSTFVWLRNLAVFRIIIICRQRATRVAFLRPGSNSARTTPPPPPPGGGANAYKADTRKPKGLTRRVGFGRLSLRIAESSFADQRYRVENKLLLLESVRNCVERSEFESSR